MAGSIELKGVSFSYGAGDVVREAAETGVLEILLGAVARPLRLERLIAQDGAPDAVLRLGALCVCVREDADRLRERLRLSNLEHRRLRAAIEIVEAMRSERQPPQGARLGALVLAHGAGAVADALRLGMAENRPEQAPAWRAALAALDHYAGLKLPVSGEDFKKRGLTEGRAIGAALKYLQAQWIRAGFPREPGEIARLIDEAARQAARSANGEDET